MAQSIDRAVQLLRLLVPTRETREYGVLELSRRSGLPLGTVHRLLEALAKHGLVRRDPETRKYGLGWTLVEFGLLVLESTEIRRAAYPIMQKLAERTQETIYLAARDGCDGVFIEKADSPLALRIMEPLGMRSPLHRGASRRAILAFLTPEEQDDVLASFTPPGPGGGGPTAVEEVRTELRQIRDRGYAVSVGETTAETAAVAIPIRDHRGRVCASLSAAGPATRFTREAIPGVLAELKSGAAEIEARLGSGLSRPAPSRPGYGAQDPQAETGAIRRSV